MKTNEFKRKLEENGFSVELINENPDEFEVIYDGLCRGYIIKSHPYHMSITYYFADLDNDLRRILLDTLYEYARTPVEERENQKKYYLKHRWLVCDGLEYLCYDKGSYIYFLSERPLIEDDDATSEFTQEDINSIKRKFNTSLEDFEMIEVQNED